MMKQIFRKTVVMYLLLAVCGIKGYGQVMEENRHLVKVCPGGIRAEINTFRIGALDDNFWLNPNEGCRADMILRIEPSDYNAHYITLGAYPEDHSDGRNVESAFWSNLEITILSKSGSHELMKFAIEGPAYIDKIKFYDNNNYAELASNYACSDKAYILITAVEIPAGALLFGFHPYVDVECRNAGGAWVKVKESVRSEHIRLNYSDLVGLPGLDPHQAMYFRTKRELADGSYSISEYIYTDGQPLRFLPKFELPAGSNVKIIPPDCLGEATTIKIPYEGNTDYTVTVKGREDNSFGGNPFLSSFPTEIIDGVKYYVLTRSLDPDDYYLNIENKEEADAPCPAQIPFTVPNILKLEIKPTDFLDEVGGSYQITKNGGTGRVQFEISNSKTQSVTVHAGNNNFTRQLAGNPVNGYYRGTATINLSAGKHIISVSAGGCTSEIIEITLNQPDTISYKLESFDPKCYGEKGSVKLSEITGGINPNGYRLNSGDWQPFGVAEITINDIPAVNDQKITIRDGHGNSLEKSFNITAPSPVKLDTVNTTITSPTTFNGKDGTVKVIVSGGTSPYTYSKTDNDLYYQPTNELTGFESGDNQKIYVKDSLGCVFEFEVNIPIGRQITVKSITTTAPTCYEGNDGQCVIVIGNLVGKLSIANLPDYRYTVSNDTIIIRGLIADTDSCIVVETLNENPPLNTNEITVKFEILGVDAITIVPTVTPVTDKGSATGKIKVGVSGGNSGSYKVILFDKQNNQKIDSVDNVTDSCVFENLTGVYADGGKPYTIEVFDSKNCSTSVTVQVQEPEHPLKLNITLVKPVSCHDGSDAIISISGEGGWHEEYKYSRDSINWSDTTTFSNLPAGIYTYYVIDQYGGRADTTLTVANPPKLEITVDSITDADCFGASTGSVRFLVSGGTPPYSLAPDGTGTRDTTSINGNMYITVGKLPKGTYIFTLRDSFNCSVIANSVIINQPDTLTVSISAEQPVCEENGSLSATASGGTAPYTYELWASGATTAIQTIKSSATVQFNDIVGGENPNNYRILVKDANNCEASQSETISSYVKPALKDLVATPADCFGESNGTITVTAVKGTADIKHIVLTRKSDNTVIETNTSGIFKNLSAGDYDISIYDENDCPNAHPYLLTVREPDSLTISVAGIVNVKQKGDQDGKIVFNVQGGNNNKIVRLINKGGQVADSLSIVNSVQGIFYAGAGEYYLEVEDGKHCTFITDWLKVEEPAEILQLIIKEVNDALCKSQTGSIEVTATGGWGDYRFKRAIDKEFSILNRFEGLLPGTYQITVRDSMGATASQMLTVYEPQDSLQAEITAMILPTCGNNGSISIHLSGGTPPYQLSDGKQTLSDLQEQTVEWTGLSSGSVLLYLLDANGCRFNLEVELPANHLILGKVVLHHPNSGTADGSIRVNISGGTEPYTFQWTSLTSATSGNAIQSQENDVSFTELQNISGGYYNLTATDAGGCSVSQQIYLANPEDILFNLERKGDETSFKASNGYAVLFADMELANYTVISPQLQISNHLVADVTEKFSVQNDTLYMQNLSPGQWFVSGRNSSGEQAYIVFEIIPYHEFLFTDTLVTAVSRPGNSDGRIRVEVQGGGGNNRFTWTNEAGVSYSSTDAEYNSVLQNIPAGKYTVVVEDRYANQLEKTMDVPEPEAALELILIEQQNKTCKDYNDAHVRLSAVGGWGDYQFRHHSEEYYNNSSIFYDLATGNHYFYLIDKLGTIDSLLVTITEPEYLRASVARIDSVLCKGAFDGKILFDIIGGTPPYSFKKVNSPLWTEGNEATGLNVGFHTFIFTDSNGCEGKDTLTVYMPEPDSLLFKNIEVLHTICNEDNGEILVELQGGTRPYYYRWLDGNNTVIGTDSLITGLKRSGFYRLEVSDANGCTQYMEQLIQPSKRPVITKVETSDVLCYGNSTGTAKITAVEAGEPYAPYTFLWSNGTTGESTGNLPAGRHSVTVTDENDCATTYYFEIFQPDSLYLLIMNYKDPHCFGYSDGYIHTQTIGGAGGYTYLWSNGATTANNDNITKGDYWVRVTDANGCVFERQFTLNEPAYQHIDLGKDIMMCPGNTHVIDGGNYVSYRWFTDKGDISTDRYLSVTKEDRYYLEAKTPDGCSAWGEIGISIGNNALQADLLLASQAAVGDTLYVFEISNLPLDSLIWEYDTQAFTRLQPEEVYNHAYVLVLQCNQTGVFNIGMQAFSGGCYSPAVKQVEILIRSEDDEDEQWGVSPMIKEMKVFPNPNDGNFTVEIELREVEDVNLILFEVASGRIMNQRTEKDSDTYNISYAMSHLNAGVYALIVTAGKERRQAKIIINKN